MITIQTISEESVWMGSATKYGLRRIIKTVYEYNFKRNVTDYFHVRYVSEYTLGEHVDETTISLKQAHAGAKLQQPPSPIPPREAAIRARLY